MRAAVVFVLGMVGAAAGCDVVFGLTARDAGPNGDARTPDAPHVIGVATLLMDFKIAPDPSGAPIAIGDLRGASATIVGTPGTFVPYQLTATGGTFTPASGEIEIGANGSIVLGATFTAGSTVDAAGTATLTSGTLASQIAATVSGLTQVGSSAIGSGGTTMNANALFGVRLSSTSYLKHVGVATKTMTNAYVGIYSDVSGLPSALLAQVGPVALADQSVNDLPITNVHLTGAFWVVAIYDRTTDTPVESGVGTYFIQGSGYTYGPLPATLGTVTPSTLSVYQLSAKVAP